MAHGKGKKQKKYGPTIPVRQSGRIIHDGMPMIWTRPKRYKRYFFEKPKHGKSKTLLTYSFASICNSTLVEKAQLINVSIGSNNSNRRSNLDKMKNLEHRRMHTFIDEQPDIFLPADIDYTLEFALEEQIPNNGSDEDDVVDKLEDEVVDDSFESTYRLRKSGKKKKIVMMMDIAIWNIRGLNAHDKTTCVSDFLAKHKPDIITLSKTKKNDFSPSCLRDIANFHEFEWNWLSSKGTAGGILVGINLNMFEKNSWYKGKTMLWIL
jgi:hypothetical protein